MKSLFSAIVLVSLFSVITSPAFAQPHSVFAGNWELNVAKSKSSVPLSKSSTFLVEDSGAGIKTTITSVSAEGVKGNEVWSANFDGAPYPIVGDRGGLSIALTRINVNTFTAIAMNQDGSVNNATVAISVDGKTRTTTSKRTYADGTTSTSTLIYDKQ